MNFDIFSRCYGIFLRKISISLLRQPERLTTKEKPLKLLFYIVIYSLSDFKHASQFLIKYFVMVCTGADVDRVD